MYIPIYYSSITGNTKKLAEYIKKELQADGHEPELFDSALPGEEPDREAEVILVAFWCRRSGMDDFSLRTLSRLTGKKILAIGTIGGNVSGPYGDRVRKNVREVIEKENTCLGVCICQGAINLKRVQGRRMLPKEDRHYLSDEKYARFLETQGHPDEADLRQAAECVRRYLPSH